MELKRKATQSATNPGSPNQNMVAAIGRLKTRGSTTDGGLRKGFFLWGNGFLLSSGHPVLLLIDERQECVYQGRGGVVKATGKSIEKGGQSRPGDRPGT